MTAITWEYFQPFESQPPQIGLAFPYDRATTDFLKDLNRRVRYRVPDGGQALGWLGGYKLWFVHPAVWPAVQTALEAAGHTVRAATPEPVAAGASPPFRLGTVVPAPARTGPPEDVAMAAGQALDELGALLGRFRQRDYAQALSRHLRTHCTPAVLTQLTGAARGVSAELGAVEVGATGVARPAACRLCAAAPNRSCIVCGAPAQGWACSAACHALTLRRAHLRAVEP